MSLRVTVFRRSLAAYDTPGDLAIEPPTLSSVTILLTPMLHRLLRLSSAVVLVATGFVGCSPQPGAGIPEDVIEIEEIEMAPRPSEPAPESGANARREVDAEKAAADKAIDEAARSIQPPSGGVTPEPEPAANGSTTQPESTADQ